MRRYDSMTAEMAGVAPVPALPLLSVRYLWRVACAAVLRRVGDTISATHLAHGRAISRRRQKWAHAIPALAMRGEVIVAPTRPDVQVVDAREAGEVGLAVAGFTIKAGP